MIRNTFRTIRSELVPVEGRGNGVLKLDAHVQHRQLVPGRTLAAGDGRVYEVGDHGELRRPDRGKAPGKAPSKAELKATERIEARLDRAEAKRLRRQLGVVRSEAERLRLEASRIYQPEDAKVSVLP